ncbi:hypothetical protein CPB86DRAFT_814565 [Serendipita vermifera]|nr:hypothetical protein CPB86DRAFT_814565 [Serendipita vermifera]
MYGYVPSSASIEAATTQLKRELGAFDYAKLTSVASPWQAFPYLRIESESVVTEAAVPLLVRGQNLVPRSSKGEKNRITRVIMPGPDYTIFAITDLSMCTAQHNGDTSFLTPYTNGAKQIIKSEDSSMGDERETDPSYGFDDFLASMDILVCGRLTYEQIMHNSKGQWPYLRKRLIVFSSTPLGEPTPNADSGSQLPLYPPPPGAEAFPGSPSQLVQKLAKEGTKSRKFKRESVWVMGGPKVRGAMLQLGVVERIELVMVPKILNDGIPLWSLGPSPDDKQDVQLELIECRSYENGVVGLSYSVVNAGGS